MLKKTEQTGVMLFYVKSAQWAENFDLNHRFHSQLP
jgi:hypothetical protein